MNCHTCQHLLSDFLDNSLAREDQLRVSSHLSDCPACAGVRDEITSIVSCGADYRDHLLETPPNPQALWLRISNIIESEFPLTEPKTASVTVRRQGWFSRTWQFTLPQLAGGVAVLVLAVSAVTMLGLRNWSSTAGSPAHQAGAGSTGKTTDQIREQQIAYWDQRVQERKAQWNQQTREAFERNVQILDQAVADYRRELVLNPNDEVSAEMLNSALNEKIALLQDFAE